MSTSLLLAVSVAYVGALFAVAAYGDRRARRQRSLVNNPYIYALSLAVYCTAWTFYGSVGYAATSGIHFLPTYIGPTLMAILWWGLMRKIVRISAHQRITSIADFIGARYGKSALLAGVATVIAVVGVVPYIAVQLKAIATSFVALTAPHVDPAASVPLWRDTALYAALVLAAFAILFGTRHLDVTERHEGLVVAVAFESVVKLAAFLAVGLFVTFGLYSGPGDLFQQGAAQPAIEALYTVSASTGAFADWMWLTGLSMLAVLFLPRQFQVTVVENVDESHLRQAAWLFPLYLLLINLFVLPIAVAGLLHYGDATQADLFVLLLPLSEGHTALAVFAFIGGLSAATSMVIVAATALSTMICNDLVVPLLLRLPRLRLAERPRLTGLILGIRRVAIVVVLLLGYLYLRALGNAPSLVSIGLISFAAVAQFAPAMLGGIFWKRGTRTGALLGLGAGFALWGYTLPLPLLAESGWLPASFITEGPFGLAALRPYALLGMQALNPVPHTLFWSLLANGTGYVAGSLATRPSLMEQSQASRFVDVFRHAGPQGAAPWKGSAPVADLRALLQRFLGPRATERALRAYRTRHDLQALPDRADEELVDYVETLLSGAIGAASARAAVGSVAQATPLPISEVMEILDEAQQMMAYSRELERKKAALEAATDELRAANRKLKEVDHLKDEFVSTVSHELRTPLTAIRAISEIMHQTTDLAPEQQQSFATTIMRETERLTRLVNQVLDLERLDAAGALDRTPADLRMVVRDAIGAVQPQFEQQGIALHVHLPDRPCTALADRDRMTQVLLNLLANAAKYSADTAPKVAVRLTPTDAGCALSVTDNGPGIPADQHDVIFERFRQARNRVGPQAGSGLGLAIARQIVQQHGGTLGVDSALGAGATFTVHLPAHPSEPASVS